MNGGGGFWTFFPCFSRNAYFLHGNAANATFPEPATLLLLTFAAAGWFLCRGRAA
jgi:PEP-CTERM motif